MIELGIVDIREIIRLLQSGYHYDFSNYALTSFKQRLERFMRIYAIDSGEQLMKKLADNPSFFDLFLYEIAVPSTEMFRDPSLWRWLREDLLPEIIGKSTGRFRIWLPNCVSGGELYTLAILLNEAGLTEKVQVVASCLSDRSIETIRKGGYDLKKLDVSQENYRRFNGPKEFTSYYTPDQNCTFGNLSLISKTEFRKTDMEFDSAPQNNKLILFRNSLIYSNPSRQEQILHKLYDSLSVSGYLITGIREKISGVGTGRDFEVVNESEGVYRKLIQL
jgi:chemotaxis protein methyltransferase CheR